jgi:hypothetical protein
MDHTIPIVHLQILERKRKKVTNVLCVGEVEVVEVASAVSGRLDLSLTTARCSIPPHQSVKPREPLTKAN